MDENILHKLEAKITAASDEIHVKLEQANEMARNASEKGEQVAHDLKTEINGRLEEYNNLLSEKSKAVEAQQKQLNDIEAKIKRGEFGNQNKKSDRERLIEKLEKHDGLKAFAEKRARSTVPIEVKAVGNMLESANLTGTVIQPTYVPGIIEDIERNFHVRSILPSATTASNVVYYVEETGSEGGPTTVAEGNAKSQMDFDFEQKSAPVKKIAVHLRISEEMLNDIPALSGFVTRMATQKLMIVEDAQLLYGTGLTTNLTGVTTNAAAYAPAMTIAAVQKWDILAAGVAQLASAEYSASHILVNTKDFYEMTLIKDTQERYLGGNAMIWSNGGLTIYGVPVLPTTAVTAGDFIIGDFRQGAQIFQREGISVRFYEQDQDNAIKNLVTIVLEERLAFPIYRPDVFIHSDFATADHGS